MDYVLLSRLQFALATLFHMLWPLLTIGLSLYVFTAEALWLRSGDAQWYRQARFWTKLFLLNFAVGVASGLPLEFQFGTNWAPFSAATGNFLGSMLAIEGASAFMIESAFLYIMVAGWKRVPPGVHLFATGMVALGATTSAFWIMVANSWMQTPAGGQLLDGVYVVTDRLAAIFNPSMPISVVHMWLACLETTAFVVGGISAWHLLRGSHAEFFTRSLKFALVAALVVAPLQGLTGDMSGQNIARYQPAKLAATESHWRTNPPGQGAGWSILAWPDRENERNSVDLRIPYVLSILSTHDPLGTVTGLEDIPADQRPPIVLPFYSFRVMVGIGTAMVLLAVWTLWTWLRHGLEPAALAARRRLLWAWVAMGPLSYLAVSTGWIVREVGRQPWILYGVQRTAQGASVLPPAMVTSSLLVFCCLYLVLLGAYGVFAWRLLSAGPEPVDAPPWPATSQSPAMEERS